MRWATLKAWPMRRSADAYTTSAVPAAVYSARSAGEVMSTSVNPRGGPGVTRAGGFRFVFSEIQGGGEDRPRGRMRRPELPRMMHFESNSVGAAMAQERKGAG